MTDRERIRRRRTEDEAVADDDLVAEDERHLVPAIPLHDVAAADAARAPEQLAHDTRHRRAPGERVGVPAVGAERVVVLAHRGAEASGDRLHAVVDTPDMGARIERGLEEGAVEWCAGLVGAIHERLEVRRADRPQATFYIAVTSDERNRAEISEYLAREENRPGARPEERTSLRVERPKALEPRGVRHQVEQRGALASGNHQPVDLALLEAGIKVVDGQQAMMTAREIKNQDEIMLLTQDCAMVDGVYQDIFEALKPGIRESDVVAIAHQRLFEMGSEFVEAVNSIAGERCSPHPHVFSDRLIRPGDQAVITLMSYPDKPLEGRVASVNWGISQSDGSTGFELLPTVSPTFEWIRLAQRIPVRIHITELPGESREVAVRELVIR